MKKCKITVLRKMFVEDLAKEYGVENLSSCPMFKEGQVFYADYAKPENFAMKRGKPYTSMFLPYLTERETNCFITAIG